MTGLGSDGRRAWLRRAGRFDVADGGIVVWSVAEGRRGRRWRSLRLGRDGRPVSDLLLEVDPGGRWNRLELATGTGILTLHPDPDGTRVHGNVVTPAGMRHLALGWGSDHRLVVEGEPLAAFALGAGAPAGPGPGVVVGRALDAIERDGVVAPTSGSDTPPGPTWPLEHADAE